MNYRTFGRTGWQVSEIGYGMWGMGGWTGSDDEQSLRSLQRAVDLGCNFFDTAWGYGEGKSEALLGQLSARQCRPEALHRHQNAAKEFQMAQQARILRLDDCFPPDHIEDYVDRSLENAGLASFRPDAVSYLGG